MNNSAPFERKCFDNKVMRTCISCRERHSKRELLRLVINNEGMVIWDKYGKGQGRGAYVCPRKSCLGNIEKGNRLKRAFRNKGPISLDPEFLPATDERI